MEDQERLRRILAATGMALLLAGLLMALSLVFVGLAIFALTAAALLVAGGVSLARRMDVRPALEFVAESTTTTSRAVRRRAPRPPLLGLQRRARAHEAAGSGRASEPSARSR